MGNLKKSKDNAVVFGVLGGLGEYFNIDPVLLRVIVVVLTFVGGGTLIPVYLIMGLIMPEGTSTKRKKQYNPYANRQNPFSNPKETKRKEAEKVDEDDWSDF